jgi:hypothetical protein
VTPLGVLQIFERPPTSPNCSTAAKNLFDFLALQNTTVLQDASLCNEDQLLAAEKTGKAWEEFLETRTPKQLSGNQTQNTESWMAWLRRKF